MPAVGAVSPARGPSWRRVVSLAVTAAAASVAVGLLAVAAWVLTAPDERPPAGARRARRGWSVLGPGGGGTFTMPTISPHDPRVLVMASDMSGAYRTRDGGRSWRMFNLGAVVSSFAFDPRDRRVLYAGTGALLRSGDGGRTWRRLLPVPGPATREHLVGDHAEQVFESSDPLYPGLPAAPVVQAIAVDPGDSSRLYVALGGAGPPPAETRIVSSSDGGARWRPLADLAARRVLALAVGGGAPPGRLIALADTGVFELAAAGGTPVRRASPSALGSGSIGTAGGKLYLHATAIADGTDRGAGEVLVSEDLGRSWRRSDVLGTLGLRPAGPHARVGPVATSAAHGRTAYVGIAALGRDGGDEGSTHGLARTDDAGRTWRLVRREVELDYLRLPHWFTRRRGPMDQPHIGIDPAGDIAVAPGDPDVCWVTDVARAYRTLDGGRTWERANSRPVGPAREDRWSSRGLDVTTVYDVVVDPFDPRRLLAAYTDIGLQRSEDGGLSWTRSVSGLPEAWRNTAYALVFDPAVPGLVWGAFSGIHDLPRPKMWREAPVETYRGGVAVSRDGGRRWSVEARGLPESAVTHVLLDPASRPGARRLYAAAFGHGVYRSDDGGRTWVRRSEGIAGRQPFVWRLSRASDGALYVVVARRSMRGRIGDADDGALYRSTDGARRWERVPLPEGTNGPMGLAPDPIDPRRLYLAAWGVEARAAPWEDTGGGVFLSEDGGASWRAVLPGAGHVYDVTVDSRAPGALYACGFDQGAWRSDDRGETWVRLEGYDFKWGHRVVPDPEDPTYVYVATFGGGLWRGPARPGGSASDP